MKSREIRLKSRPVGMTKIADFEAAEVELASPAAGQVVVRNLWMSVDPYMRGRMYDRPSYVPPFQIGEALQGGAIGEVVESADSSFAPGDLVSSMFGWREGFVAPASALEKLPASHVPPQAYLGVMGMPGLTAYAGLLEIGQPKPGETVFVSGGAGAVGSIVAQIAKLKGCTVVASAGSDAKCDWLRAAGVDHAINYKHGNLLDQVRTAAPKGIDVYFDNVGGEHLEVAIELARVNARLVECGMIDSYNAAEPTPGPRNMMMVVGKSLTIRGFIVSVNFPQLRPQFLTDMGGWLAAGKIKAEETVMHGIDKAPDAFLGLFSGSNTGKMLIKL